MVEKGSKHKKNETKLKIPLIEGILSIPESPSEKPRLIGSRCNQCGWVSFPKARICPGCFRDDSMEEILLSNQGRLYCYSIARVAPLGFTPPYILGYIDLDEGVRIYSQITGCEPREDALCIGSKMEMVLEKIREDELGNELIGYKFKPIREESISKH